MFERIENPAVVDSLWRGREGYQDKAIEEKLNGPGWEDMDTGVFIPAEDGYKYALEKIGQDDDLKAEFVEWYFSVNFVWTGDVKD